MIPDLSRFKVRLHLITIKIEMKNKFNLNFVLSILFHVCFAVSNEFKIKNITLISNHYLIIAAILLIIICSNDKFTSDHSI